MIDPPPPPPPLTPEQQAEADKLYRHLLALRASGVRSAVLVLDGVKIGVRTAGERIDVALVVNLSYNGSVTS